MKESGKTNKSNQVFTKKGNGQLKNTLSNTNETDIKETYNINNIQAKFNSGMLSHRDTMELQNIMGNRSVTQLLKNVVSSNNDSNIIQKKRHLESERESVVQSKKEDKLELNKTGMPNNLKTGVENLSGLSMDDVRVQYNSNKPKKLGALAYTQGTNIASSNVLQGKFISGDKDIDKAIESLARSSTAGLLAWEKGNGDFTVNPGVGWSTYTKDGKLGITIPENIYNTPGVLLENRKENEVKVAHELIHLRHLIDAPSIYKILGDRTLKTSDDHFEADGEEQLTILGKAKISVDTWAKHYTDMKKSWDMQKEVVDKYDSDIKGASNATLKRALERNKIKEQQKLDAMPIPVENPTTIQGVKVNIVGNDYVFMDEQSENTVRKEKGFKDREKYSDESYEPR